MSPGPALGDPRIFTITLDEILTKEEEIPFDKWHEVTTEEHIKRRHRAFVYRPSNYSGPMAIDAILEKEIMDHPGTPIILTKEEAKIIWP